MNTLPTINAAAQKHLDSSFSRESGLPTLLLMEQAAEAVTDLVRKLTKRQNNQTRILFLAGAGNNAGDAFASARQLLALGYQTDVFDLCPAKKLPPDAALNKLAYQNIAGSCLSDLPNPEQYDFIIDGILGTGFSLKRPLTDKTPGWLKQINSALTPIKIAIDIPTGIEAESGAADPGAFCADYTVTFSAHKTGIFADPGNRYCGKSIVAPISMGKAWIDAKLNEFEEAENCLLPRILTADTFRNREIKRDVLDHKGKFGKALLIGGSKAMPGALVLALRAAHATGIGYAYTWLDQAIYNAILQASPESLISIVPHDPDVIQKQTSTMDAVLIGPGIGQADFLPKIMPGVINHSKRLIIDADGLNWLAAQKNWKSLFRQRGIEGKEPAILTPHPGEFLRLAPNLATTLQEDRQKAALELAKASGAIIVLKGHATVIAFPSGEVYINSSGNPGLSRAGSGDTLAGLAVGFLAQYKEQRLAITLAVYLHGLLADLAAEDLGMRVMTPDTLVTYMKKVYKILQWQN